MVIPCYNEEGNIEKFYEETIRTFGNKIKNYEFVFIDDGSKDKTWIKLKNLYMQHPESNIQILSFSRNFGKEAAIYAGLSHAKGNYTCIIDADLQQHPKVVLQMYDKINKCENIDCVVAYQEKRKENKIISAFKSMFYKIINKTSDVNFKNGASDFRLMNNSVKNAILQMGEYHRFSKGIFGYVGFSTEYIPYIAEERYSGNTKWSLKKLFSYAFDGIESFSTLFLKFPSYTGIIMLLFALFDAIVIGVKKSLLHITIPNNFTLILTILIVGGVLSISMGILGRYILKIYIQVKQRPIYIIKEHLS